MAFDTLDDLLESHPNSRCLLLTRRIVISVLDPGVDLTIAGDDPIPSTIILEVDPVLNEVARDFVEHDRFPEKVLFSPHY